MKLDKSQRHTAYIIMLVELKKIENDFYPDYRLCLLVFKLFGIDDTGFYKDWRGERFKESSSMSVEYVLNNFFPEAYKLKPGNDSWKNFATKKKRRVEILQQCIEETF